MPNSSQYLLIIDSAPLDHALMTYFSQFNIHIGYYEKLSALETVEEQLLALLINADLLKNQPTNRLNHIIDTNQAPLIIISNTRDDELGIKMLENGADDFLTKPIHPRELHARITAINRRIYHGPKNDNGAKKCLSFNQWHLYPASRQLFDDNQQELKLSTNEYNLLLAFLKQPHQVLGRDFLLQITKNTGHNSTGHNANGYHALDRETLDRRIDIQISRLRQKIEPDIKKPLLIKTIRNIGYMFTAEVSVTKNNID